MNKSVSVELKYNNREFGPRIDVFCNIDDEFVIRVYNFLNGKKRLIYSDVYSLTIITNPGDVFILTGYLKYGLGIMV